MKRIVNKVISVVIAAIMIFGVIPVTAFAISAESGTKTVYVTVSDDDKFITDIEGNPIAYIPITLEELSYVDLDAYGLGEYIYDSNDDNIPEITALHLYIYVHEILLGLDWSEVRFSGGAGSIFFEGGLFGYYDANLRYDFNGAYPAVDGWGLTADQIVLTDGDFVNIAHYTSWEFWPDDWSGFHYFTDESGNLGHTYNVMAEEELTLGLVRSYSDMANGGEPAYAPRDYYYIYYGKSYGSPEGRITADEKGMFDVSFDTAGTWYLWADGGYGLQYGSTIVSAPAFATVNVNDILFNIDLTKYSGSFSSALMFGLDFEEPDNDFWDETSIASGVSNKFCFSSKTYDGYIFEICTYENDESIIGWKVNGTEYLIEEADPDNYFCWELENEIFIGYTFNVGENSDQTAFYVDIGTASGYYTAGEWKIEPVFNDADPIKVKVTISDKGSLVVPNKTVDVTDLDHSGDFSVDEVLYAAHQEFYEGGAAAGYATADLGYGGLSLTKLWGDDSMSCSYFKNDDWCYLEDNVAENDCIVAFNYLDTTYFADAYSYFEQKNYTALAETETSVALIKLIYDNSWNLIPAIHSGATIKVYNENFEETDCYEFVDNGDGTYAVKVKAVGEYIIAAYDNSTPIVPTISSLTVTENADLPYADAVENMISQIGEVTLDSKADIDGARAAYDALTEAQKVLVENYDKLTAAETAYSQAVKTADKIKASEVERKIEDIGSVTAHKYNKIKKAREAYNALTETQKDYVENLSVLTSAETALREAYTAASKADHKAIYEATAKYINGLGAAGVGSTGGEWMVIALTRSGYACPEGYYENVLEFVRNNVNDKQQLHRAKSTENSRIILALTAAGYDVTDVDGHNLLIGLSDFNYVKTQGINGPIWALIAFDSYNYEIPINSDAEVQTTRELLISYILERQLADGGWALSGEISDVDVTGMAMQALAPYYNTNAAVKEALDKAIACLSNKQLDNGGFGSVDGSSSESCAQVIVALTALGINPETDERFIKNGVSVMDAMCLFALEEGGFEHIFGGGINGMATEQAQYALASYFRFLNGETALYDMTDVTLIKDKDAALKVFELISEIGSVTLESKEAIEAARTAYDALNDVQKQLVENYLLLTEAESTYAELVQAEENKKPSEQNKQPDEQKPVDSEKSDAPDKSDTVLSPETSDTYNVNCCLVMTLVSLLVLAATFKRKNLFVNK